LDAHRYMYRYICVPLLWYELINKKINYATGWISG
jgi:hypothetical protein